MGSLLALKWERYIETFSGHGHPDKDYCASLEQDQTEYPCDTLWPKCFEGFEGGSIINPTHSDPEFSHIDCGTEGVDYEVLEDGNWNVRHGQVCTFNCNADFRNDF